MREFELAFDALGKGLRPSRKVPRNTQALIECYNVKPYPLGLVPYEPLTDPFAALYLTTEWPFPQLLVGSKRSFLIVRDSPTGEDLLYQVNADWSLTLILPLSHATYGVGGRYDLADFGDYVLLTNGAVMVTRNPVTGVYTPSVGTSDIPLCKTACDFKGQAVAGNVQSSWYERGVDSIVWSNIGDINFTPDRKNEAGFREHWRGEVYKVRQLGDQIVVYGKEGILALTPVTEPAPTFRFNELADFGLAGVDAVGGNKDVHLFVDSAGWLWRAKKGGGLENLGYQEFMTLMSPDNIIISYNPNEGDFYISDGIYGFILTPKGLAQIHQLPNSMAFVGGVLYGIFGDNGDTEFRLTTDVLDFGFRPRKTLFTTEIGIDTTSQVETAIDWRSNKADPFVRTPWTPANELGISTQIVSGVDFRLCLKSSSYTDVNVDYIKQRWKMTDLRSIRGVYSPPPRGQS